MPRKVQIPVDLSHPPKKQLIEQTVKVTAGGEVSSGDGHANVMKLITQLMLVYALELTDAEYNELRRIYDTPTSKLTLEQINKFETILASAQWHPDQLKHVRLLGDILGDRGNNDFFILLLLDQLHKQHIPYTIMMSNHDAVFFHYFSTRSLPHHASPAQYQSQYRSMHMLRYLNKRFNGQLSQRVKDIVKTAYNPHSKLIDYRLVQPEKDANIEIELFGHAPISLATMRDIANMMGVPSSLMFHSPRHLATTIDLINFNYRQRIKQGNSHELFRPTIDGSSNPIFALLWNRNGFGSTLGVPIDEFELLDLPFTCRYIHGHTPDIEVPGYLCFDEPIGKTHEIASLDKDYRSELLKNNSFTRIEIETVGVAPNRRLTIETTEAVEASVGTTSLETSTLPAPAFEPRVLNTDFLNQVSLNSDAYDFMTKVISHMGCFAIDSRKHHIMLTLRNYVANHFDSLTPEALKGILLRFIQAAAIHRMSDGTGATTNSMKEIVTLLQGADFKGIRRLLKQNSAFHLLIPLLNQFNGQPDKLKIKEKTDTKTMKEDLYGFWGQQKKSEYADITDKSIEDKIQLTAI